MLGKGESCAKRGIQQNFIMGDLVNQKRQQILRITILFGAMLVFRGLIDLAYWNILAGSGMYPKEFNPVKYALSLIWCVVLFLGIRHTRKKVSTFLICLMYLLQIVPISSFDESIEIIDELGIKASDLLQANGIIWVEGPSDRIYIKNWLEMLYPETFIEGRDYQFVYYGGRLLAHYTACDPINNKEIENYINVLAVNAKAFFIMDSDKSTIRGHLAKRKKHIIDKLDEKNIPYWVTKGREIENYLNLLTEGIQLGQFDKLSDKLVFDKVKFAKEHYQNVDFGKYDLRNSINKLATEIKRWNDKR